MDKYLKRLANFIVYVVTLLGILAIIEKKIDPLALTIIIEVILLVGFIFLTLSHISQLEKQIENIEQKFIRAEELKDMRKDIEAIKLILLKKK